LRTTTPTPIVCCDVEVQGNFCSKCGVSHTTPPPSTTTEPPSTTTTTPSSVRKGAVVDGENVTIADALEILKFLAGLPGVITTGENTANAIYAARITVANNLNPSINCVLEILKYLAGLPNIIPPKQI
jgi:hypothetical protein